MSDDHNLNQDPGWRKRQIALDIKAENARELGLDYEPDKTIQEMARAAQLPYFYQTGETANLKQLEAFAALVREKAIAEANAKANASWTLMCKKAVANERERIARWYESEGHMMFPVAIPDSIRSNKHD